MNIEEVKTVFKQRYAPPQFDLVEENAEELYFKHRRGNLYYASKEELRSYAVFEARRNQYVVQPNECSMVSKEYREQVISFNNRRAFFPGLRNSSFTFGEKDSGVMWCEIGKASMDFKNFFRFHESYFDFCITRARINPFRETEKELLENTLFSPTTIKVFNIKASSIDSSIEISNSLIDAVLFTLSYMKDITLTTDEEWPQRLPRNRRFTFGEVDRGTELPLPKGRPIPSLVRFYQRAMSSDDPVNAFLSFYQCLEYFFVTISDELLYEKLTRRLNDPRFQPKPNQLDRIIQDTLDHKRESDETEMLKAVLTKFVDPSELIEFIESYEEFLGDKRFTRKRKLFGEDSEVKLNEGHVIGNVAARIKRIRNSLVHSSDRYKREEVFIPTPQYEAIIEAELPLVKYLAERVVVASSGN